jgi:transcriptional regulator with XRE-family HTH domain
VGSQKRKAKDPETERLQAVLRARLEELIDRFPGRQTELAEKAGLKQSNISETFSHMPTLLKALKICRAAGVTLDWFTGAGGDNALEVRQKRAVDSANQIGARQKKSVDKVADADKAVDRMLTRGQIGLQRAAINANLLEYILKVVRGLDFWNELNPEEQAERVAHAYRTLLSIRSRSANNKPPFRASIISILRGRKTA